MLVWEVYDGVIKPQGQATRTWARKLPYSIKTSRSDGRSSKERIRRGNLTPLLGAQQWMMFNLPCVQTSRLVTEEKMSQE